MEFRGESTLFLSIILVNYNGAEFIFDCLSSIKNLVDLTKCEVIIVDNSSTDHSVSLINDNFPSFKLICSQENLGFGKANNLAVACSQGEYLLFLNTDTILIENTPEILAKYLEQHQDIAAIGSRITFEDGSYQLSCGRLPNLVMEIIDKIRYGLDRKWHHTFSGIYDRQNLTVQEVGWLTGACLMMRRDIYEQLGGFDESFFMYFEDKDICKRVRDLGSKVVYYPNTSLIHLLGGSSQSTGKNVNAYYRHSQVYYYEKHLGRFQAEILKLYLRFSGRI
jgi:N-acetylglucosaminyl-diphospho-decaprenol L-rhamnosyltransferase